MKINMPLDNEILVLTQLNHPNIIKLLDVYEKESYYQLVAELLNIT